jgi:hypothetical protein
MRKSYKIIIATMLYLAQTCTLLTANNPVLCSPTKKEQPDMHKLMGQIHINHVTMACLYIPKTVAHIRNDQRNLHTTTWLTKHLKYLWACSQNQQHLIIDTLKDMPYSSDPHSLYQHLVWFKQRSIEQTQIISSLQYRLNSSTPA